MENYIDKIINKNGVETPIRTKVDNSTIKYNSSGELSAITSGSSGGANVRTFLKDKRVCFIGDSITDSTTYPKAFCNLTGAIEYNRGRSGANITNGAFAIDYRLQICRSELLSSGVVGLPRKPHLFIVYGGHNDWGHGLEFGDPDSNVINIAPEKVQYWDSTHYDLVDSPTDFCSGVRYCFRYLKENYPDVPVIALSYHHAQSNDKTKYPDAAMAFAAWSTYKVYDWENGTFQLQTKNDKTWYDYRDAYEKIAKEEGATVISLEKLPFSPFSRDCTLYYKDGLHFSNLGGTIVGEMVAREIAEINPNLPVYEGE